ncbi:MAG: hypothetical protein ACT4QF_18330 [Sporichthyaceae bacterium]
MASAARQHVARSAAATALPLPERTVRRGTTGLPTVGPSPVEAADRAGRASFVVLVLLVLSVGLVGLLVVNTALARNSFTVNQLQRANLEQAELSLALQEDLARAESPATLAKAARELGMVPARSVAYLRLADGTISGRASTAKGAPAPLTPEQAAEQALAKAQATAEKKAKAQAKAKADAARAAAEARARAAEIARSKVEAREKALRAKVAKQNRAAAQGRGETVLAPPTSEGRSR